MNATGSQGKSGIGTAIARTAIHRIDADGVTVFYREAGPANAPVLLLLHGFPTSSIVGPMPVENASVYSATKAAVDAVTIALSKELGPKKIRVNSLNPGMVETEGLHAAGIADSDFRKTVEAQTPLGRIGRPEDIARVAVFYASDDAAWVTGQTLVLAGGQRQ